MFRECFAQSDELRLARTATRARGAVKGFFKFEQVFRLMFTGGCLCRRATSGTSCASRRPPRRRTPRPTPCPCVVASWLHPVLATPVASKPVNLGNKFLSDGLELFLEWIGYMSDLNTLCCGKNAVWYKKLFIVIMSLMYNSFGKDLRMISKNKLKIFQSFHSIVFIKY